MNVEPPLSNVQRLIIFTRYPEPGKSKTRLIPALGPHGAAVLQTQMTRRTLDWARRLAVARNVQIEVLFAGGDEGRMAQCFGREFHYAPQGEGDLGRRMWNAFQRADREGAQQVVIVGADCPEITPDLAAQAFTDLQSNDLVLGPAEDGGYYLIGLSSPGDNTAAPSLFVDIPWGGEEVLAKTMHQAKRHQIAYTLLSPLPDVDRPEDLAIWRRACADNDRVSVIIPTLNDNEYVEKTLDVMQPFGDVEVIVVDGAKPVRCSTQVNDRDFPVYWFSTEPGRAHQMNLGAEVASGSLLLFLHADTCLPPGFDEIVRQTLVGDRSPSQISAGAFRLTIDDPTTSERIIAAGANLRARWLGLPYGDQALFLKADLFHQLGGFAPLPLMEDFDLVRRLRRRGRIAVTSEAVITSPRRWRSLGPWRAWLTNQTIVVAYHLGVSPRTLARWYRRRTPSLLKRARPRKLK